MAKSLICCLRGGRVLSINKFQDANTLQTRISKGQNIPSYQVEGTTYAMTKVTDDTLQHSSILFATKEQPKMVNYFSFIERKLKKLRVDLQKINTERCNMIREAAIARCLEDRRHGEYFSDELSKQMSKIHKISHQILNEIQNINDHYKAAKDDVLKYYVGGVISISGGIFVGLMTRQ